MTALTRLVAAVLLALSCPGAAWAQGALLQGGAFVSGRAPMYASSGAQAVLQDSGPAGGGGPGLGLSEFLQVNRAPGTGQLGTHNCLYDAPITSPFHFLCFDADVSGNGLLTVGAGGGASPIPFNCNINGVLYTSCLQNTIPFTNSTNYVATPIYSGTAASNIVSVIGSLAAPDTSLNAAGIFQKIGTGPATGSQSNPALYVSNTKTSLVAGNRATAIIAEGYDTAGGNGTFVEGGRFHATVAGNSGQADGLVCVGQSTGPSVVWDYLIGCEADIENLQFDSPPTPNTNHLAVGFLATNAQGASSHVSDAGFAVNGSNAKPYQNGFIVLPNAFGGTAVSNAAFSSYGHTSYGLDLSNAVISFAAIELPNNSPIRWKGVGNDDLNVAYVPQGADVFILGTSTNGIALPATNPPLTPGVGFFSIYVDITDGGKLKAKGPNGTVTTLALP